jgi:putative membrane protein
VGSRCKLKGGAGASAGIAVVALLILASSGLARARNADASPTNLELTAVDYNFVAQANLGAPFQIESGRIAEAKAGTTAIRDYAHLMVFTHIPVVDALDKILNDKRIKAPPDTLLDAAYHAMIASLRAEHGVDLDRDYVEGQVEYQRGECGAVPQRDRQWL